MKQPEKKKHMSGRVVEPSRWWYARHDWMPGGEPTLRVMGTLTLEDSGITGYWRVRTEEGIVGDIAADSLRRRGHRY
jgi:hypothetical protein